MIDETPTPLALLIGGDAPTRMMLRFLLEDDGHAAAEVSDPAAAVASSASLLIVVAGEREDDPLIALTLLRRLGCRVPTLLLARDVDLELRKRAFALGVHDVVGLPATAHDLQIRLRAALGQRARPQEARTDVEFVRAGGLTLHIAERKVVDGTAWSTPLTRRETALLAALMAAPGQAVGYCDLLDHVWGKSARGTNNALAVYVRRLRAKLARPHVAHGYVCTVHGRGYVFDARATPRQVNPDYVPGVPRVLVVDDDRATVAMIAETLNLAGYSVASGVGADAPILAREKQPTVILLDINMPGMDGIQVRQRLRENPRTAGIPVIAVSGGGNLRSRAGEMGADDYLAKPFEIDELLLRIEKWAGPAQRA